MRKTRDSLHFVKKDIYEEPLTLQDMRDLIIWLVLAIQFVFLFQVVFS